MALETTYMLRCDECSEPSEIFDGALFSRAQMISELRKLGWLRARGGRAQRPGTFCPRCSRRKPRVTS